MKSSDDLMQSTLKPINITKSEFFVLYNSIMASLDEDEKTSIYTESQLENLKIFGGMYNILESAKGTDKSMNFGDVNEMISKMLEIIDLLKETPVIRSSHDIIKRLIEMNAQIKYDKDTYYPDTVINYYASPIIADLLKIGLDSFWCKHPETLEFLYRHRHWYFITVEMCVNHGRKDMLDKLFIDFRETEYIKLYETCTDIKAKFDLMACYCKREKPDDEFEKTKIMPEFENEVLTNPEGIGLFAVFESKITHCTDIQLYQILSIDFMKYPHLVEFVESECKRDPKDSFGTIISWDNLAAAEIHIRVGNATTERSEDTTNWFTDINNYKELTHERLGINIAKKLKREFLVEYYNLMITGADRNFEQRYLDIEVLDYIGIAEVPRDLNETLDKFTVNDGHGLWGGYRPDLESREKYYQHVAKKINERISVFKRNRELFDYFVKDSKIAIETKSPNSDMYLKMQRHPVILTIYISADIKPQFEITAEDIKTLDPDYGGYRLLRKLYVMGYREELRDLEHPSWINHDNDVIFLTQVLQLRSNRYSLHKLISSSRPFASGMRLLKYIDFGGKRDVHINPTEDYQKAQNRLYAEYRGLITNYFEDHQYN